MKFTTHEIFESADSQAGVRINTLVAVSVAVHLLFLALMGGIAGTSGDDKKKNYISVDLIQSSRRSNQAQFTARPRSIKQTEPEPQKVKQAESAPEAAMTLNPRIGAIDAPVSQETSVPQTGLPSNTGTNYQSMHRISRPPVFRKRVTPEYPAAERNAAREARVVVEVFISMNGIVDDVKLLKSGGAAFDEAVIQAVKASSFEPGYMDGRQVAVRMQIPYVFRLR